MNPSAAILVCLGGAIGALCRYWIGRIWALRRPEMKLPAPTLFVNLTGSLFLGILVALAALDSGTPNDSSLLLFGGVGFCGAYTTFSSFCTESISLMKTSRLQAATYAVITIAGSIAFFAVGMGSMP